MSRCIWSPYFPKMFLSRRIIDAGVLECGAVFSAFFNCRDATFRLEKNSMKQMLADVSTDISRIILIFSKDRNYDSVDRTD